MNSIKERFEAWYSKSDISANKEQLFSFFRQELLALAETVEKRQLLGNVGHIEFGFNQGIKDAATTIRTQAETL